MLFENNFKTTFKKAEFENKPVFIEYYNSNCPVCNKVEHLFSSDEKLVKFYNNSFVNYRINTHNISKDDSLFIAKTNLSLMSVPYFLFFDSKENLLHISDIEVNAEFLINIGIKALNPNERSSSLENKYKKGDRSIKTLYAYSQLVQLYKNDSLTNILADNLYKSFPKNDLGNNKSYIITKNCVNSIDNGFFKFWIKDMDKLIGLEPEKHKGEEKQTLADIVHKSIISKESKSWNLEKIDSVKTYILLTQLSKNPDAFFWKQEVMLFLEQKNYDKALSIGKRILNEDKKAISVNLYTIRYFMNVLSTVNELNTIKEWVDEVALGAESITDQANIMYLNALYFKKNHQTEQAKETISKALKFYEINKMETTELNDLNKTY